MYHSRDSLKSKEEYATTLKMSFNFKTLCKWCLDDFVICLVDFSSFREHRHGQKGTIYDHPIYQ
jgi:hypothetical protein